MKEGFIMALTKTIREMLQKFPLLDSSIAFEHDKRDYTLDMVETASPTNVPESFNLEFTQNLKRQYSVGSCVSCAVSMGKDILDDTEEPYSQWFLHANRSDDDFQGEGARIREVLSHICNDGIVYLKDFNEVEDYPKIRDILHNKYDFKQLLEKAAQHESNGYISLELSELKRFISHECSPVFIGIDIYENFYDAPHNKGVIPSIPTGKELGGHRMLIVGYTGNILKLANWWGEWGGQGGYLYLDMNSPIIRDLFVLTDKPIKKPHIEKYRVGWNKDSATGKWIYSENGLSLISDSWKNIQGEWYYFKGKFALDGEWILLNNKWYYLEPGSCKMSRDKWLLLSEKWYRFSSNGEMLTGWYQNQHSEWFYLDLEKGYSYCNSKIFINGEYYIFNTDGVMQTGWYEFQGHKYYLEPSSNGHKGRCYTSCSCYIEGKKYSFDNTGKLIN